MFSFMYVYCVVEIKQNWTSDLTKALIIFRDEMDAEFASEKKTHKSLWKQISEKHMVELDYSGNWLQCQSKFNKLAAKYKAVGDANKKSGERRRSIEFHSEMMAVMGDDPIFTPLKTVFVGVGKGVSVMCSAEGTCKPIEESENNSQSTSNSSEVARLPPARAVPAAEGAHRPPARLDPAVNNFTVKIIT